MNLGEELYNKLSQRDYSGSKSDNYAQLLQTLFLHLAASNELTKFFNLLDRAKIENKQISVIESDCNKDEYFFEDLILISK